MAPRSRRIGFIVYALLLIPAVGAGIVTDNDPSPGLRRYREDFDALATGSVPCQGISDPAQCFYSITTGGSGGTNAVDTAPAGLSGKAWKVADVGAPFGAQLNNVQAGVNLCNAGQSISFVGVVPDLALNTVAEYRIYGAGVTTAQGPAESIFMRVTGLVGGTNNVNFGIRGVTGAESLSATGTIIGGNSFTLTISQVNCSNQASALFSETGISGIGPDVTVGPAASGIAAAQNRLALVHTTGAGAATSWLDNYDWQGAPFGGQPTPFITELDPDNGIVEGGTVVDIIGGNFQNGATVTFDGTPSFGAATFVNSGLVRATSPPHAAGEVELILSNPDGQMATAVYTYGAPAPVVLFEDFEDEPFGTNTPDEDWYTITKNNNVLQIVGDGAGGKRLRNTYQGANQMLTFLFTESLCSAPGTTLEFDSYFISGGGDSLNSNILKPAPGVTSVDTTSNFIVLITGPSAVNIVGKDSAGRDMSAPAAVGTFTPTARHVALTCTSGGPLVGNARAAAMGQTDETFVCGGLNQPSAPCAANSGDGLIDEDWKYLAMLAAANSVFEFDNIRITTAADAPAGPNIVIAPTQLKGFDVTPSGSTLVTREGTIGTDTGRNVVLYNGNSLAAGPTRDTDCNFDLGVAGASIINSIDGVNAGNDLVSYYKCSADDATNINQIEIRVASSTFANPEFPETCEGACYADIPDEELAGDDDVRRELSDLAEYPFDFSRHFSQGSNHIFLTWGFSTVEGDVGVVALSQINGRADESRADSKVVDATGTLQIKICTTRISNQDFDLIYGVGNAANGDVKGFKIGYTTSGDNLIDTDIILTPSLDTIVFAGGQINGPYGIGCAENLLLTQQSGGGATVDLWNVATNTHRVVASDTVGLGHSQALNPVATIGAYVDGATIKVFRTDTLVVFQNLTLPSYTGVPCGMFITGTGTNQALWWGACGATGTIAKYELTTPFDNQTFNPGADTDGDGIPNINDPDIDGDGIPNTSDPDIDGDGIPNETDTDDDGDGLLDANDPSPGGTATGPGAVDPDADGGQGLFGVSRRNAIIFSGVMVLAALLIGFAVTTTKRRRQVNND